MKGSKNFFSSVKEPKRKIPNKDIVAVDYVSLFNKRSVFPKRHPNTEFFKKTRWTKVKSRDADSVYLFFCATHRIPKFGHNFCGGFFSPAEICVHIKFL